MTHGKMMTYPLVNVYITMENHHFFNGNIHYKWAMFNSYVTNYQRVMDFDGISRGLVMIIIISYSFSYIQMASPRDSHMAKIRPPIGSLTWDAFHCAQEHVAGNSWKTLQFHCFSLKQTPPGTQL